MDFSWSEDQLVLRDSALKFGRQELNDGLAERDRSASFSMENWKKCADFGIQGLAMPERYGGSEHDPLSIVLAMESLGHGCEDNGLLFALGAQMWSVQMPTLIFGSEGLKERYLPGLISGQIIGAHAVTEPGAGSDVFSLRTTVRLEGSCYVLNERKTLINRTKEENVNQVINKLDN